MDRINIVNTRTFTEPGSRVSEDIIHSTCHQYRGQYWHLHKRVVLVPSI